METEIRSRKHTKSSTTKANKKNVKQITSKDNVNENVTQFNIKNNVWNEKGNSADDCNPGVFQKRDEVSICFNLPMIKF